MLEVSPCDAAGEAVLGFFTRPTYDGAAATPLPILRTIFARFPQEASLFRNAV